MRVSTIAFYSILVVFLGCSESSAPPESSGVASGGGGAYGGVGGSAAGPLVDGTAAGPPLDGTVAGPLVDGTAAGPLVDGTWSADPDGGASDSGGDGSGNSGNGAAVGPVTYALPPPSQCHNADWQDDCIKGDASSRCGGVCNTINACQETTASKPGADVTFICPRFMLFSPEMRQAAIDDGNAAFNYAIVGHDADRGGIDGQDESTCCQCYQLVYAYPSPRNDLQAQTNPDKPDPPSSAIPIPKPLIVQSFNTAATPHSFDVYMAGGGFGANNSCGPGQQPQSASGLYLYTSYPTDGQPSQGGVKPASLYQECKTEINWVTTASLSSTACQDRIASACNQMESNIPGLTEQGRNSCISSNHPDSFYHLNWSVYAMKVECPTHLTEVTGCKLAPQGLPAVDPTVTTAAEAASNSNFYSSGSSGEMYETTTMEDCCRPSCASKNWVSGRGLTSDPEYNAFYSCDVNGVPFTE